MIDMHLVVEELLVQIHISALKADLENYSSGNHNEFLNVFIFFLFILSSKEL